MEKPVLSMQLLKTKIFLVLEIPSNNNVTFIPCYNCPEKVECYLQFVQVMTLTEQSLELHLIKRKQSN